MKILELSYSLSSGGGERFVVDLCNRLAENDENEVVLLTTDDDSIPKNVHYLGDLSPKVRFVNLHCPSGLHPKSFWRVYKTIKKEQPDIVHAHCGLMLIYLPALFIKNVRYVHTLHNLARVCLRYGWCKPINKKLYAKRIQPITISDTCQQSYTELYGIENAVCITNGREPSRPSDVKPEDTDFLKNDAPVFIHVARCAAQKNQPRLFRAFDRLQSEGTKFQLIVLGSNYESKWMPRYKDNPRIHILGERKNVADYMALADFFVLSSDFEGLPLTLLEAMSLGVIPICTPAGGIADVIEDGCNGYMTKTFDDDEFYRKIEQAIREKGRLNRTGIRREYELHYSMETCADKYYKIYRRLLGKQI